MTLKLSPVLARLVAASAAVAAVPVACGGSRDCAETLTCNPPGQDGGEGGEPPAAGKGGSGGSAGHGGSAGKAGSGGKGGAGTGGRTGGGGKGGGISMTDAGEAGTADSAGGEAGTTAGGGTGGSSGTGGSAGGAGTGGAPARCDPESDFQLPVYVPSFSSRATYGATMTGYGLDVIVWEGNDAFARATRATQDATFGMPVRDARMDVAAARQALSQGHELPNISSDGLVLFMPFGGQGNVYINSAKRNSTAEDFPQATALPEFADKVRYDPYPSFDNTELYFIEGGAIHYAVKGATTYGPSIPLTSLDSPQVEYHPIPLRGELAIYFSTTRADGTAKGKSDVWRSQRADRGDDFDLPHAVDVLNTSGDEYPVWVAPDDCEIFLIRYIPDNVGGTTPRLMSAKRPL